MWEAQQSRGEHPNQDLLCIPFLPSDFFFSNHLPTCSVVWKAVNIIRHTLNPKPVDCLVRDCVTSKDPLFPLLLLLLAAAARGSSCCHAHNRKALVWRVCKRWIRHQRLYQVPCWRASSSSSPLYILAVLMKKQNLLAELSVWSPSYSVSHFSYCNSSRSFVVLHYCCLSTAWSDFSFITSTRKATTSEQMRNKNLFLARHGRISSTLSFELCLVAQIVVLSLHYLCLDDSFVHSFTFELITQNERVRFRLVFV